MATVITTASIINMAMLTHEDERIDRYSDPSQQPRGAKSTPSKRPAAHDEVPIHIDHEVAPADASSDDPWGNLRDRLHTNRPGFHWDDDEETSL